MSPRRHFGWKISTVVLAGALALVLATNGTTTARAAPSDEALMTLGMLHVAKDDLAKAPNDTAGHKKKALEATNLASKEVWRLAFKEDPKDPPQ